MKERAETPGRRTKALVAFFVLAYAFSWASFFLTRAVPTIPLLFPFGPLIAALVLAGLQGREGYRELARRCLLWRVRLGWYAAALLVPILIAAGSVGLNILIGASASKLANVGPWYAYFIFLPMAVFDAPLGEDSGWRGYAMTRFSERPSNLSTSLLLGVLIAGWHLPLALSEPALAAPYLFACVGSAVVTNWVYYNSGGSALLAILYHSSANAMGGAGFNLVGSFSGADLARGWWLLAGMNWLVASILVIALGPTLMRRPKASAKA